MKLKIVLSTASALALLAGAAWAGSSENYVDQSGDYNNASVDQSVGATNLLGTVGDSVKQTGDRNDLDVVQSNGSRLGVPESGQSSTPGGVDQTGDYNILGVTQKNGLVQAIQQTSTGATGAVTGLTNRLQITQGDSTTGDSTYTTNRINSISQTYTGASGGTDANIATILQNITTDFGHLNQISSVSQNGSTNRLSVSQKTGWQSIATVSQEGINNKGTVEQGTDLGGRQNYTLLFKQKGNDNFGVLSLRGSSNGSQIGIARAATDNLGAALSQEGDGNQASLGIDGNGNGYGIRQSGDRNIATGISVSGNLNDLGIGQFGSDNVVTLADIGNDANMVGLVQRGDWNTATGLSFGSNGTVDILQNGVRNATTFSQTGDGNNATVKIGVRGVPHQVTGIDADRNKLNIRQDATGTTGNSMTVTIQGDDNNNYGTSAALVGDARAAWEAAHNYDVSFGGQGSLFQKGSNNSLTVLVQSDLNAFATYQNGADNMISHKVLAGGDGNQAVIAQIGSGNQSATIQSGVGNNIGIKQ